MSLKGLKRIVFIKHFLQSLYLAKKKKNYREGIFMQSGICLDLTPYEIRVDFQTSYYSYKEVAVKLPKWYRDWLIGPQCVNAKHIVICCSQSGFKVCAEAGAHTGDSPFCIRPDRVRNPHLGSLGLLRPGRWHGCASVGYSLPVQTSKWEPRCLFW